MTSLSQKNLINLAKRNEPNGDMVQAIQNLEEALRDGHSNEVVLNLCDFYLKNKQSYSAYELIKEEKDLFTDSEIFAKYSKILSENHFLIEALEVKNITDYELPYSVEAVNSTVQQKIMVTFRQKAKPTKYDYDQLFKLDLCPEFID